MVEKKINMRPLLLLSAILLGGCSVNPYRWPGSESQSPAPAGPVAPPVVSSPEEPPLSRPQPAAKTELLTDLALSIADAFMQAPETQRLIQAGPVVVLLTPPKNGTGDNIDTQSMATVIGRRIEANSHIQLVDSAQVAAITSQLEYQSGSVNLASLVRLGRQAGAGYLLYGDLVVKGHDYRLTMTLMNPQNGELLWSGSRTGSR